MSDFWRILFAVLLMATLLLFTVIGALADDEQLQVVGGDACVITSNVNLGGNNLTCSGVGTFTIRNVNITSVGDYLCNNGCNLSVDTGGNIG